MQHDIIDLVYREDKAKEWRLQFWPGENGFCAEFHIHRPIFARRIDAVIVEDADIPWLTEFLRNKSSLLLPQIVEACTRCQIKGFNKAHWSDVKDELVQL